MAATRNGTQGRSGLYTEVERLRRDQSMWTMVQAVLAPFQFLVFIVSVVLVLRSLATGADAYAAHISVLAKTLVLLTIMVTGSLWEKDVFGQYLFAPAFFWEDVVSFIVIALHLAYVVSHGLDLLSEDQSFLIALAAYATYIVNAVQFLLKLRAARLEAVPSQDQFTAFNTKGAAP